MADLNSTNSPFEIVTGKTNKKVNTRTIVITAVIVILLILGIVAGVLLVKQQQNISEKASASLCPAVQSCPVAGQSDLLRNCSPGNADGTPQEASCSNVGMVGKISACGTQTFCCPSLGASWTTDLTLCTVASATPTPTIAPTLTPTASASATPTATATISATPKVQTTPLPIPVSGTNWPTILGAGIGGMVIIGAILLAL